ncbi:MAG: acetone carboxylase subunit gamma [Firmicutes bacterium]|nr:acetophenone carboxylase [Alicyclobacillaceae bacterium]MCL6498383.1 acetone carboxylase subunit gamma [Bacillota bacterium]
MARVPITEALAIETTTRSWVCRACGHTLIAADRNYKEGCLVWMRDPREVHRPLVDGAYTFAPDPDWVRILEFICPGCGHLVEVEYLPPGHPVTWDLQPDVDALVARYGGETS